MGLLGLAEDVLRFKVQVDDVFLVHVADGETDLPHEEDAIVLRQSEVVRHHLLKELPSTDEFLERTLFINIHKIQHSDWLVNGSQKRQIWE